MSLPTENHFSAEHDVRMDPKGRVPVPAAFRRILAKDGNEFVTVSLGPDDKCLRGFSEEGYRAALARIDTLESENKELRARVLRKFMSNLAVLPFDAQGRILIPQKLRDKVGLSGDITYVGVVDYFEIWDSKRWVDAENETDHWIQSDETRRNLTSGVQG